MEVSIIKFTPYKYLRQLYVSFEFLGNGKNDHVQARYLGISMLIENSDVKWMD